MMFICSSLSHKYVIGFKGISARGDNDLYIVTEFVENGSLYDYLDKLRKQQQTVSSSSWRLFPRC